MGFGWCRKPINNAKIRQESRVQLIYDTKNSSTTHYLDLGFTLKIESVGTYNIRITILKLI